MQTRRVALLTSAFFTSLALVLRRGDAAKRVITGAKTVEEIVHSEDAKEAIKRGVQEALVSARMSGASGPELLIMGLAGGIAGATRVWNPSIEDIREELSKQKTLIEHIGGKEALSNKIRFRKAVEFLDRVLYPATIYLSLEPLLEDYVVEIVKLDE